MLLDLHCGLGVPVSLEVGQRKGEQSPIFCFLLEAPWTSALSATWMWEEAMLSFSLESCTLLPDSVFLFLLGGSSCSNEYLKLLFGILIM